MYRKAKITLKNGACRVFVTNDEDSISEFLYNTIGDTCEEELSGVPTFMEAASWCPLANIGETFEREAFVIEITE